MDYIKELRAFPLLAKIKDDDIKILADLLEVHKTQAGENIITEGDTGSEMYILIDGVVDIIKTTVFGDKFVVATLDAAKHCVFGEMAMVDNDKRSATVKAKTACTTLSIDHLSFEKFCDEHPESGVELLRLISINLVRNIRTENNNLRMVYQALIEEIETN
ncbi:MAG: cyclic nucleotide-binding domain-containing protein [Lachnospiraceae bacterium]|jgi:CRP-like cAMP-binding protein|nr:cyclic nucleotide-binding domain-containing protein [Lachnospiraceae bacterium]